MLKSLRFLVKLALFVLAAGFIAYQIILIDIPDVRFLQGENPTFTSYMNGDDKLDEKFHADGLNFKMLSEISPTVVRAILAAEDDSFYEHHGFAWDAIRVAIERNLKKGKFARGASTITQQLARNLFLNRNKSLWRKLRETLITRSLESTLSKDRILELYLNTAEMGPGIYGIAAAARYHFGTTPKNLSNSQAATIAALLPNPKFFGKKPYPNYTAQRQQKIIKLASNIVWRDKPVQTVQKTKPKQFIKSLLSIFNKNKTTKPATVKSTATTVAVSEKTRLDNEQPKEADVIQNQPEEPVDALTELDETIPEEVFVDE